MKCDGPQNPDVFPLISVKCERLSSAVLGEVHYLIIDGLEMGAFSLGCPYWFFRDTWGCWALITYWQLSLPSIDCTRSHQSLAWPPGRINKRAVSVKCLKRHNHHSRGNRLWKCYWLNLSGHSNLRWFSQLTQSLLSVILISVTWGISELLSEIF